MTLHPIAKPDEIPEGEARKYVIAGREIAVVNLGGGVYKALGDLCSHAEAYLHEGEVDTDFETIECPRHGSTFDLDTGAPKSLPATQPVPTYPVTVDDDQIKVEI